MHGRGVAENVGGDAAAAKRRAARRGRGDRIAKPRFHAGPGEPAAGAAGEERVSWPGGRQAAEPLPEVRVRALPEGHGALLAAFAADAQACARPDREIANVERHDLGDPRAGVVERLEHDAIATTAPAGAVGRV